MRKLQQPTPNRRQRLLNPGHHRLSTMNKSSLRILPLNIIKSRAGMEALIIDSAARELDLRLSQTPGLGVSDACLSPVLVQASANVPRRRSPDTPPHLCQHNNLDVRPLTNIMQPARRYCDQDLERAEPDAGLLNVCTPYPHAPHLRHVEHANDPKQNRANAEQSLGSIVRVRVKGLFTELLRERIKPIVLWSDNQGAIHLSHNLEYHARGRSTSTCRITSFESELNRT